MDKTPNSEGEIITMVHEDLSSAPDFSLSAVYQLRWYQPGDEEHWVDIQHSSDQYNNISHELFHEQFAGDLFNLNERQCYLLDVVGNKIATGTIWGETSGPYVEHGLVHWVAVIPEYQQRGIGTMIMSIILQRLLLLGYPKAFLRTSSLRQPAIKLYEKFGFRAVDSEA